MSLGEVSRAPNVGAEVAWPRSARTKNVEDNIPDVVRDKDGRRN